MILTRSGISETRSVNAQSSVQREEFMRKQIETNEQDRTIAADRMYIDWDVPIRMDDGIVLRADVFRPAKEGRYPV
jgi:predicted acyl esterase